MAKYLLLTAIKLHIISVRLDGDLAEVVNCEVIQSMEYSNGFSLSAFIHSRSQNTCNDP